MSDALRTRLRRERGTRERSRIEGSLPGRRSGVSPKPAGRPRGSTRRPPGSGVRPHHRIIRRPSSAPRRWGRGSKASSNSTGSPATCSCTSGSAATPGCAATAPVPDGRARCTTPSDGGTSPCRPRTGNCCWSCRRRSTHVSRSCRRDRAGNRDAGGNAVTILDWANRIPDGGVLRALHGTLPHLRRVVVRSLHLDRFGPSLTLRDRAPGNAFRAVIPAAGGDPGAGRRR